MEFQGKVIKIFPARNGISKAGKSWSSQDVLFEQVNAQSQFPRSILVSFFNKESEVNRLTENTIYTVSIDIDAREYNGRWYNDVRAWKVQPQTAEQPSVQQVENEAPMPQMAPLPTTEYDAPVASNTEPVDDLPF